MGVSFESLRSLSDEALVVCVGECVDDERRATARLLAALGEFDSRRLFLGQGFNSLFAYCVGRLHLSERAAYSRIEAARLARRFPISLELVADSRVSLTAIALLARHLNEVNYRDLLAEATHKTVREVEVIVARLAPRPDAASSLRGVHQRVLDASGTSSPAPSLSLAGPTAVGLPPAQPTVRPGLSSSHAEHPRAVLMPTATERYKLQVTLSRAAHDKLRCAQNLLRHSVPSGDLGTVVERAIDALLDEIEKKKLAFVARPASAASAGRTRRAREQAAWPASRHIPAAVRRAVWKRDGGRCAFVGAAGRCAARAFLQLHHVRPFAAGGEATIENIELRCRAHNAYEEEIR